MRHEVTRADAATVEFEGLLQRAPRALEGAGIRVASPVTRLGKGNWTFFVPDDGAAPVVSWEDGQGSVLCERWDPVTNPSTGAGREVLAGADFSKYTIYHPALSLKYSGLSDHWHVYAHGYHWIAGSLTATPAVGMGPANPLGVGLARFTVDSTGQPQDIHTELVYTPRSAADYHPDGRPVRPTNDLFVTPTPEGVAVGVLHSPAAPAVGGTPATDKGHTLFLLSTVHDFGSKETAARRRRVELHGSLGISHENGSSCRMFEAQGNVVYQLLATDSLSINNEGSADLLALNDDFQPVYRQTLVGADPAFTGFEGWNISMMMSVSIPAPGYLPPLARPPSPHGIEAAVYKQIYAPDRYQGHPDGDNGDVFLWIRPDGFMAPQSPGYPEHTGFVTWVGFGNQPHIAYWDDHLIVSFTEKYAGSASAQRVYVYPILFF